MLSGALLAFLPIAVTPEVEGVSSRKIVEWINACEHNLDAMHGFVLLRHGKLIAEGSWAPYDTIHETHRLYSHSKSFTATAIGFLVDDGKLDIDERVVDIFPDKVPAHASVHLGALRVRDLLTMNVGASRPDAENDDADGDWAKAYLENDFDGAPGVLFKYDSGASYMLSEIVKRKSGCDMIELLQRRLFSLIGIESALSTTSPTGVSCGGWGMCMTTRDLALFGQFYLNRGCWQGRRILSDEWVTLATARQSWSGAIGVTEEDGSDWHQGYGFQFWRCRHGCYRADGANGQFTIVMPRQDAVLSIHSGLKDTQKELDLVWNYLLPAMAEKPLTEDELAVRELRDKCQSLGLPSVCGKLEGDDCYCGCTYRLVGGVCGLRSLRLDKRLGGWNLTISGKAGKWTVPVGFCKWERGVVKLSTKQHEILRDIVGEQRTAASAAVGQDGALRLRMLFLDGPQKVDLVFRSTNDFSCIEGVMHGIGGGRFSGYLDRKDADR